MVVNSVNTQTTLVSNNETTEQITSRRNQLGAYTLNQDMEESATSRTLSNFSTADSQLSLLPDPPTHEPGEKSKKKGKGKISFLPSIKSLKKIGILKK